MLDGADKLVEKIRLGEDAYLEYKQVVFAGKRVQAPARNVVADALAAFATAAAARSYPARSPSTSRLATSN